METSFKRSHVCTATLSTPNPAAGHHWPTPSPETPGHSQASLGQSLWGHCSFLLGPGVHKFLFVPSKSLQSCVNSESSMVGLMVTSSKRAYAVPKSAAFRPPAPATVHCWPIPPQETLKHSSISVSVGSLSPGAHRFVWALWASLAGMGFDSQCKFPPPTVLLGLFHPWMWGISQLLQRLTSCWGFSALGCGVSPHDHFSTWSPGP